MGPWTAAEIARITGGALHGDPNAVVMRFVADSRAAVPEVCFVALRSTRDGHDFVGSAMQSGAAVALVTQFQTDVRGTQVVVGDAFSALGALGRAVRAELLHASVVAVAGSAGKTSTKDLTAAALAVDHRVHANEQSFNNEFGVPFTLFAADPDVEFLITEFGERKPGDLAHLAGIVAPNTAIVTHVGLAHAEFLGGQAGVAATFAELLTALPRTGMAVLNADDEFTKSLMTQTEAGVVTVGYGIAVDADVRVSEVGLDAELRPSFRLESPWGGTTIHLELRGDHHVTNAAMAATVALHAGVDPDAVADALGRVRPQAWRMDVVRTESGITVINDAYNANPGSMAAALRALQRCAVTGRRIAVLGAMYELGEHTEVAHAEVGDQVTRSDVDFFIGVGDAMQVAVAAAGSVPSVWVPDAAAAVVALSEAQVGPGDAVLIKASRGVGLESLAAVVSAPGVRP
ncbi:MAG: UDP-N-acetylmuramoyl-tripeptide--D-alanyl-D-alanine ligase [Acidimicrobiia bacterium]